MKKIYIKYKILVNGFSTVSEYKIDNFSLKTGQINEEYFSKKHNITKDETMKIDFNSYIYSCISDYKNLYYRYFENEEFIEYEISNKTNISKDNVFNILDKYPLIISNIDDLERKLRIIFNIPLMFQNIHIDVYDNSKIYICNVQLNKLISTWNRLNYNISPEEASNNSRFHFDYDSMKATGNNYFNRALDFFNNSFESEKIEVRYILLFSCLEAIFNLTAKDITTRLASVSAKLLAENNQVFFEQVFKDIKKLYEKRCNYIHGSKLNNIMEDDEKNLRRYTRKIIIAYWTIILNSNMTAKQILEYLENDEKLDIQIRMIITALNSDDFSSQQQRLLDFVEKKLNIRIPEETRNNLLSNSKK